MFWKHCPTLTYFSLQNPNEERESWKSPKTLFGVYLHFSGPWFPQQHLFPTLSISQRQHLSFITKFSNDKVQSNSLPRRTEPRSPTFIHYFLHFLTGSLVPSWIVTQDEQEKTPHFNTSSWRMDSLEYCTLQICYDQRGQMSPAEPFIWCCAIARCCCHRYCPALMVAAVIHWK